MLPKLKGRANPSCHLASGNQYENMSISRKKQMQSVDLRRYEVIFEICKLARRC